MVKEVLEDDTVFQEMGRIWTGMVFQEMGRIRTGKRPTSAMGKGPSR